MKNRIKELRIEKGLRQRDVAERLGVSAQSYGNYENGINKPDPDTLAKLADFYGVSIDYLLCREDDFGNISLDSAKTPPILSKEEQALLSVYRKLPDHLKRLAVKTLSAWNDEPPLD